MRLLTEQEMERMRDLLASGPLHRRESDKALEEMGLSYYDAYEDGLYPTTIARETFYLENGSINPLYYRHRR